MHPPPEPARHGATTALEQVLPAVVVLGVAAGCLVLEQLVLALAWRPPHGWAALLVAPIAGVLLPLAALCRAVGVAFPAALRLRRPRAGEAVGAVLVALGTLVPAHAASRALARWVQPPDELMNLYAELLPTGRWTLVAGMLAVVVVAPLAEEILFRGLVLRALARLMGSMPAAVAASALVFGAVHGSLFLMVPIAILGFGLGALAWRSGVTAAWIAHATFNAIAYVELCTTRDVAADAVARFATQPLPAVALSAALVCGGWMVVRCGERVPAATATRGALQPGDDPTSGATPHL
jgi:membrane protease YdiL (CAAX protease family)